MHTLPGWAVILPEEKKKEGELYLPETAQPELQRGEVIEVDPVFMKDGITVTLNIKKGDKVVYRKYYDNALEENGKKYKVVKCEDIMVKL